MKGYKFEIESYIDLEVEVISYSQERPAPYCQNPDHPNYSDSGDPMEVEYNISIVKTEKKWSKDNKVEEHKTLIPLPDELYTIFEDQIIDAIQQEAEEKESSRYTSTMEDKYEDMKIKKYETS